MIISDDQRRSANKDLASKSRKAQAYGHRMVMRADFANFRDDLQQIEKCGNPWPCRRSACPYCGGGNARKTARGKTISPVMTPPKHQRAPIRKSSPDSYIRRKGVWMAEPFAMLPRDQQSVLRVTIRVMDADENPCAFVRKFRRKLTDVLNEHLPHGILRGFAEIAVNHANARYSSLPQDVVGPKIWASGFTDMPCYNLHMQGAIFHPGLDRSVVNAILRSAFPGKDSVWLAEPDEIRVDDDGNEWGGIQGWGEYSGFELKQLNFLTPKVDGVADKTYDPYAPHENDNFAVAHVRLMMLKKCKRSMRNFKYRDDENSIMEAITNAWVTGTEISTLEFSVTTLVKDLPKTSVASLAPSCNLDEYETGLNQLVGMPLETSDGADIARIAYVDNWYFYILKRSRQLAENFPFRSMARISRARGFCDRPGIEKPP